MIKHIVCWNLLNRTEPVQECSDALAIKAALEGLAGRIPGLLSIEVGFDFSRIEPARDLVLYSEFESKEALEAYQKHPLHVAAATGVVRPRTRDRVMVDYEC